MLPIPVDWDDLRLFAEVARGGSFSAAGRALRIDASTVSRRMHALEDGLDAVLFQRSARGVRLTDAGERLQARLVTAAAAIDLGVDEATRRPDEIAGVVRLASPTDMASALLIPLLAPLHREHPKLTIHYLIERRPADLEAGEADIAIRTAAPTTGDLRRARISSVALEAFAAPSLLDAEGHRDVTRLPWLEYLPQDGRDGFADVPPAGARVVLSCNDTAGIRSAARLGLGVALLPDVFGRLDGLVPLPTPWPTIDAALWLVAGRGPLERPAVRAVWTAIKEAIDAPDADGRVAVLRARMAGG